jgi:hypothetical protein
MRLEAFELTLGLPVTPKGEHEKHAAEAEAVEKGIQRGKEVFKHSGRWAKIGQMAVFARDFSPQHSLGSVGHLQMLHRFLGGICLDHDEVTGLGGFEG